MCCTDGMPVFPVHSRLIVHCNYCSLHSRLEKSHFRTHRKAILEFSVHFSEIIARSMLGVTTAIPVLRLQPSPRYFSESGESGRANSVRRRTNQGTLRESGSRPRTGHRNSPRSTPSGSSGTRSIRSLHGAQSIEPLA